MHAGDILSVVRKHALVSWHSIGTYILYGTKKSPVWTNATKLHDAQRKMNIDSNRILEHFYISTKENAHNSHVSESKYVRAPAYLYMNTIMDTKRKNTIDS